MLFCSFQIISASKQAYVAANNRTNKKEENTYFPVDKVGFPEYDKPIEFEQA
jgi:hypothetical protein